MLWEGEIGIGLRLSKNESEEMDWETVNNEEVLISILLNTILKQKKSRWHMLWQEKNINNSSWGNSREEEERLMMICDIKIEWFKRNKKHAYEK